MIIVDQDNALPQKRQLCNYYFYHYRSRRYIIWRSSCRYYPRGRYKYSCIAEFIHWKIIYRGIMHSGIMHCGIMHRRNHASRVNNYAWREDFMSRRNLYIARRIYASQEFMHRGIMHRGNHASRVNNCAWREDFMPRQNLYVARRIYASREFMHSENHASRKSCIVSH